MSDPKEKETTPAADGDKQTPVEPSIRKTGQATNQETRPGADAEAPGAENADSPGSPNQGTEAR
jgi:hypothetical protein